MTCPRSAAARDPEQVDDEETAEPGADPRDAIAAAQAKFAHESDSVGQKRQSALIKGRSREALEIAPNLWAGVGLVRGGAGTALVGSPEQVAARPGWGEVPAVRDGQLHEIKSAVILTPGPVAIRVLVT